MAAGVGYWEAGVGYWEAGVWGPAEICRMFHPKWTF
jgi:hypothetical protein